MDAFSYFGAYDRVQASWKYSLETGRKNQIRVHSADMGHPVCGDVKYGNGDNPLNRLCFACIYALFLSSCHRGADGV